MTHANYNRRFRNQKQTNARSPARKLVSFDLGSVYYAVPIERVQRVVKDFNPYGFLDSGNSLVRHQEELITLIDLSKIFKLTKSMADCNYLIVCTFNQGDRLGIPIPDMPKILEISEAAFCEIPLLYRQQQLPAAVEKLISAPDGSEVFYLNLDLLSLI
ncbi:MAG: chemotaxis protein CheW [Oscillatoriales cyanobacterium]|nr:MAG: chemotaxis protein CheW [Oscillatoriales cyanobacterium]TAF61291.1 MAG: chemotaxis protein CheW [Oscillatoriales cyanobacterium]TAG93737.1 MAG: chemotaxis protein CheW [Oscillatoriales cyanobacterium]TAH17254.1 MAG: chemotaxis protein CheW [Oscillatoriales cyanobacterium]